MSNLPAQSPPNLRVLFDALKLEILKEINCCLPGIIKGFDTVNQSATIQIAVKKVLNVALDGTETYTDYPLLIKCPAMILSGGSGHLTFPIAAGDSCIVLFNDREIDNWWFTGEVSAPTTARLHDKSDALAIVGIRNTQNAISNYFNGTRLQHDANTRIDFTAGAINIYGDVTVHGQLRTLDGSGLITYNTHVHGGVQSGGSNTGGPV